MRCKLGLHLWGFMRYTRLAPSIVYRECCNRCGAWRKR